MGSHRFVLTLVYAVVGFFAPAIAVAQDASEAPAHVAYVDGSVTLEHEGAAEPAISGMPFLPGDRLRSASGRV